MAPNKFATMLHRRTNRITLVLVYAALEWALIFFLLLNSLFSYLIIKFANYFGLKPPCLLCSRLDHILEPQKSKSSYRELICEQHAIELSRSGYCFNHRKLVESQDMCDDCSSSPEDNHQHPSVVSVFRWLKEIGVVKSDGDCKVVENGDMKLRCSCCGATINIDILSPHAVIKPSSGCFEDTRKANRDDLLHDIDLDGEPDQNRTDSLVREGKDRDAIESSRDVQMGLDSELRKDDDNSESFSFWLSKGCYSLLDDNENDGDVVLEAETEPLLRGSTAFVKASYADETILPQHLEFCIGFDDDQLIPVELVELAREKSKGKTQIDGKEDRKQRNHEKTTELWRETDEELVLEHDISVAPVALDFLEKLNSSSLALLKLDETKIEELPNKQGNQELKIKREIDVVLELDENKMKELSIKKGHGVEKETKREVGDAVVLDANKVEVLPTIQDKLEAMRTEIDFQVADHQAHDVPLITFHDQATEEREVTELNANIITADLGDVCHIENDEIDVVNCVKPKEKSQVVEPSRPCNANKVEVLPTIQDQEEATRGEIDFQVAGDQAHDAPVITIHDQAAEEREATDLNANITTADLGDVCHVENDEIDLVNSVKPTEKSQVLETSRPCKKECPFTDNIIYEASTSSPGLLENGDYESKQTEETQNHNDITAEITEQELKNDVALPHEPNEVERDRTPDTPNSMDSLHHLHKEALLLRRMESADEETLDGSVANELDNGGAVTIEDFKSVLKSERKTLRALYAELEEERNASAIATNQTMAMINRLQEEKATIEMEALQYQRMMEEQSEYDQEALQLMNEILVKREKELQELEKELEIYRKKVVDYEERERMRLLSQRKERSCTRSRTSSASCSNGEDSDGLSIDMSNESKIEDGSCRCEENGHHNSTPIDAILNLQDSLSSFEKERISILEQLKVLEEKLCTLAAEEEHHIGNMKPFELFYEENANEFDRNFKLKGDANGMENGSSPINGKHHQERRMNGQKPKQLLPLFDAAELESDDELSNDAEDGLNHVAMHKSPPTKFELEKKRLAIEEEVDHVYERLHALEADREFIKHCVGSLRKGDRGVSLLQEILQHLRDLKSIELQARNIYEECQLT